MKKHLIYENKRLIIYINKHFEIVFKGDSNMEENHKKTIFSDGNLKNEVLGGIKNIRNFSFTPLKNIFEIKGSGDGELATLVLKLELTIEKNSDLPRGTYYIQRRTFRLLELVGEEDRKTGTSKLELHPILINGVCIMLHHIIHWVLLHREKEFESEYIEKLKCILSTAFVLPDIDENFPEISTETQEEFLEQFRQTGAKYYHMIVQGKASNNLQKKLTQRITDPTQINIYGHGEIITPDFKLFIRGYKELLNGVKQSAAMLLDSLMITATREGLKSTLVKLPLREYMEMRGLRDEKSTRAQVKRDIDALERISFEFKGAGIQKRVWLKVSISGGTVGQIKNGDIIFRFNQDFFDSFKMSDNGKYLYMYFPREALQVNINNHPYTYWLARKISEHKRMNLGKPNEDVVSVQTLIESCPNYPSYEEVMKTGRAVTQRIIEPFERDMDTLTDSLSWHYNSEESPGDYKGFMESTVTIQWNNYPYAGNLVARKALKSRKKAELGK